MSDQLIRIEGLLDSPVAVPPEGTTWSTLEENPVEAFLKIKLQGLSSEDVDSLHDGWVSGKKYRLQFHMGEVIEDATIILMKYTPAETVPQLSVSIHKEVILDFNYETKNYNRIGG